MSAETLSGSIAVPAVNVGIESVGPALSTPSFGGRIDGGLSAINSPMNNINVGGMHNPDLNSNLFSQPELRLGSVETFDEVVPGNLAFTHTETLWQANLKETPEETFESNQEIRADVEQAAKVKDAWITIGVQEEEAEESAFAALNEKLQRTTITENLIKHEIEEVSDDTDNENLSNIRLQIQPVVQTEEEQMFQTEETTISEVKKEERPNPQQDEILFEEDDNADKPREVIAKKAVEVVSKRASDEEKQEIDGSKIAKEMPDNPQPNEVRSEIIKESKKHDGSYVQMTKQIAGSGKIETPDDAQQIIEKAIKENPAVRITSVKTSRPVTKEDVEKVLGEEVILFTKA